MCVCVSLYTHVSMWCLYVCVCVDSLRMNAQVPHQFLVWPKQSLSQLLRMPHFSSVIQTKSFIWKWWCYIGKYLWISSTILKWKFHNSSHVNSLAFQFSLALLSSEFKSTLAVFKCWAVFKGSGPCVSFLEGILYHLRSCKFLSSFFSLYDIIFFWLTYEEIGL